MLRKPACPLRPHLREALRQSRRAGFYHSRPRREGSGSTRVKPTAPRVDPQFHMLIPVPRKTNLERQRLFRERHPERDALYKARARIRLEMLYAVQWAGAAEPLALPARPETLALPAARQLALPAIPVRLALPAPVEVPAFIAPLAKPEPVLVFAHERRQLERRAA